MTVPFADTGKISKPYWGAFQANNGGGNSLAVDQITRIFGNTKVFDPQRPVTRGQAALAIQSIGIHFQQRTAEQALPH
jgi:hypothetical protein